MRVRVIKAFAHEGRVYSPGVHALTNELADDADILVREGLIIVFFDADDHPIRLTTPESGQRLVCRSKLPGVDWSASS